MEFGKYSQTMLGRHYPAHDLALVTDTIPMKPKPDTFWKTMKGRENRYHFTSLNLAYPVVTHTH